MKPTNAPPRHPSTGRFIGTQRSPNREYQMPAQRHHQRDGTHVDKDGRLGADGRHDRAGFSRPGGKR